MKKKLIGALLVLALLASLCASASADHLTGSDGWLVTFTADEKMETNFDTGAALSESYAGLQPGDDITLTVTLRNDHTQDTDWYMTNNVLKSLEDEAKSSQAHGAGYTYRLTYTSPKGDVRVLFDSENVGGEILGHGKGVVRGAVVHYDKLEIAERLIQTAFHGVWKKLCPVPCRQDYAHRRRHVRFFPNMLARKCAQKALSVRPAARQIAPASSLRSTS